MKRLLIVVTILTIQFAPLVFAQDDVKESEPPKPECGDFSACFNAAAMAFSHKDYAGAIALFTRASEFGDDNQKAVCKTNIGNAWYNTGLALSQAGNYEDAIKAFNTAIENGINTIDLYMFRGYAYLFVNDYTMAFTDFKAIVDEEKGNERAQYLLRIATIYGAGGGCGCVVDWLKKHDYGGLPLPPQGTKIQIPSGTGREYDSYQPCSACQFQEPYNNFPVNPDEVFITGNSYENAYYPVKRGELEFKLSSAKAYTMRGKAFLQTGRYENAIQDLSSAVEMTPDYTEAYLHRATAFEKIGQPVFAIEDLQKYLDLSPNLEDTEKQEIEQRIQALKSAVKE